MSRSNVERSETPHQASDHLLPTCQGGALRDLTAAPNHGEAAELKVEHLKSKWVISVEKRFGFRILGPEIRGEQGEVESAELKQVLKSLVILRTLPGVMEQELIEA